MSWSGQTFSLDLPAWVSHVAGESLECETVEDRMALVIELARRNVEEGTGGPFAAAVFESDTGRLVAPGVNLVVPTRSAVAHAEIVSIALAGQVMDSHDLGGTNLPAAELVTSTEPCAMCFGAVPWSGVTRLVCGARDEDARAVGFDEGPKMDDWAMTLEERGIEVIRDVDRERAAEVLRDYVDRGGLVYNGRSSSD